MTRRKKIAWIYASILPEFCQNFIKIEFGINLLQVLHLLFLNIFFYTFLFVVSHIPTLLIPSTFNEEV